MDRPLPSTVTEQPYEASRALDGLATREILALMNAADAGIPAAVGREIPHITLAVDAIATALGRGGHLFYIGAGTSGRLGVLDAAECPPTFGVSRDLVRAIIAGGEGAMSRSSESAEDDPESGVRDLIATGFNASDVVIGIAASGRTPYVLGAMTKAREIGAITCGISCVPDSELSRAVQFPIEPVVGPEILTGSTRLRAGTATKLVLNMISTAVMVRLGHVYGNLMVNVQPSNVKLADRARRIIAEAGGVDAERAATLFEEAGRSVRTAIVMAKRGVDRAVAEQLLEQSHGRIAEALKS